MGPEQSRPFGFLVFTHSKKQTNSASVDKHVTRFDKAMNEWYNSLTDPVWDNLNKVEKNQ